MAEGKKHWHSQAWHVGRRQELPLQKSASPSTSGDFSIRENTRANVENTSSIFQQLKHSLIWDACVLQSWHIMQERGVGWVWRARKRKNRESSQEKSEKW
jgi:hypothetical protein